MLLSHAGIKFRFVRKISHWLIEISKHKNPTTHPLNLFYAQDDYFKTLA